MNAMIGIAIKDVKTFFRERGTVFWTIAFPVVMLLLFSAIFGREVPFTANIGIVNHDTGQFGTLAIDGLSQTGVFNVKVFENESIARKALETIEVRATITIPEGFSANLTEHRPAYVLLAVDSTNPDIARIVSDGVERYFAMFYKGLHPNYTDPIVVVKETTQAQRVVGYKEYITPGVLCYPLLFSSMVASTGAIVYEREKGTLKKIRASPIRPLNVLFGKTLAALFQTAISILIIAVLAKLVLNPLLNWNLALLIPIMFLGALNGVALGLLISCIGRSPQEASGAATTIAIVLQFFIGMYFPVEYLPVYLQQVGKVIPMTYAAQAIRDIMIRDAVLSDILYPMLTITFSAIVLYAIGILLYKRWVEKE